jgi:thiamine kinase-like enzyme
MADAAVEDLLDRISVMSGKPRKVADLGGGLTNNNYRVTTDDGDYVVRVNANSSTFLGIDRDVERTNSARAFQAGVGAEVVDYLADDHVLVLRFLEGRTLTAEDVRDPKLLPLIAGAIKQLHSGPVFVSDFDMRTIRRRYLDVVRTNRFRIPTDYLDLAPAYERLEKALVREPEALVPCNNDLLAANFIRHGQRIWIIDYEYSGQNEPSFELGNLASENGLSEEQTAALAAAYYGAKDDAKTARALAWALLARYGWTLWASIQDSVSDIDFDFWGWGQEKYESARQAVIDGDIDALIRRLERHG